ncbi:c-type cytochrome [Pontixanthobacter aestiaquae]|uniref:C-type cytochrome n=1 Tax=Pontixanthobacter aestiaquae TaxID=1509367 RepID=A0A844Z7I5_9SPHN|nr:c-type cytochrome [Pontixanthobacter aestiaquae]MDN3647155.1 c-type cytochrome [Pontixanthobacter aestiaquae]MXO81869.1 c-type cytochrome [Pontixanthobacter aestiaquae]
MRIQFVTICTGAALLSACGEQTDTSPDSITRAPGESQSVVAEQTSVTGARPASFAQCVACHRVEPGKNGIGPSLAGVYGAKAGHVGDYAYSSALRESGLIWDAATLDRYLENPRKVVPNTKMTYSGMRSAEDRARIVAYLQTL